MSKKKIAVLFGGQSSEHVVSCVSAANVIDQINKEKYDLLLIGITEEGHWVKAESVEDIRSGAWRESRQSGTIHFNRFFIAIFTYSQLAKIFLTCSN